MNPAWGRLFLFLDEWIGIFLLVYFWLHGHWGLFAAFGIPWAFTIYAMGYPMQWQLAGEQPPAWLRGLWAWLRSRNG
jgi:hypothetical protein